MSTNARPIGASYLLSLIVGPGIFVTEEDVHRRQRRVMNPAFGRLQIKELTPIFIENPWSCGISGQKQQRTGRCALTLSQGSTGLRLISSGSRGLTTPSTRSTPNPAELATAFTAREQIPEKRQANVDTITI
ncbi:hypothetical protein B0H14DRAFT_3620357 [Mycena olivaceomarginata]|nr:hypothetical protein B0H14DRAFT_3620357 [Mycena olivaceomarginata]